VTARAPPVVVSRPPANIIRCKLIHLHYLCARARDDERHQFAVLSDHEVYDPELAWAEFAALTLRGPHFTALDDDNMPAAAGGYHLVRDGVWQSWMVGTDEGWDRHWRSITKGCRWLMDGLFDGGARRLQTSALASRGEAIHWYIEGLKMTPCGVWAGYGRNGEAVAHFERLHPGGA
jgi:hypothetical protein